jgi:hypothetical protein
MRVGIAAFATVAVFAIASNGAWAECVTVGPAEARPGEAKPAQASTNATASTVSVDGAICGSALFGANYSQLMVLANAGLDLLDEDGGFVASAAVDDNARFDFGRVPTGIYRIQLPGFTYPRETIRVTKPHSACSEPILVTLIVAGECAEPSRIISLRPR